MSNEDAQKIFHRFYRHDDAERSKIKGTGLGLAIVKGIVKKHGGVIEVESKLKKGTKFIITLPLAKDKKI